MTRSNADWTYLGITALPSTSTDTLSHFLNNSCSSGRTIRFENDCRGVHDRILMDDVLTGFYTDSETQGINRCRLYLQVECLSDICTADGTSLDPGLRDKPPTVTATSATPRPSRPTLVGNVASIPQNIYTRDSMSDRLRQTCSWTKPNLRTWHTYYDPSSQMLCQQVSSIATTESSWNYHPAHITYA
jgi:hypothetical protein